MDTEGMEGCKRWLSNDRKRCDPSTSRFYSCDTGLARIWNSQVQHPPQVMRASHELPLLFRLVLHGSFALVERSD